MITLSQPPALFGIPSLSPFGTKVETYLRMVDLPYRTRSGDPRRGPTGKVPCVEVEGRCIGDSSDILDELTSGVLMHPADNPLKQRMAGHANLVAYNERMDQRCFGDRPPGSSRPR